MSLDFIYGKTEETRLIPLDGQQRLTTLWLLHWYLALKENQLNNDNKKILKKFSYETRLTSKDFCKKLIENGINYNGNVEKISDEIRNQNWFYLIWEQDPTVVNMLNMLDIIHEKFKNGNEHYFALLKGDGCPIKFYFLEMEQFSLTDELYIKMNARGKPLTKFECFKAKFSELLDESSRKKLEKEWLDIFWQIAQDSNNLPETRLPVDFTAIDCRQIANNLPETAEQKFYNFFENIALLLYAETPEERPNIDKDFMDNYDLLTTFDRELEKSNGSKLVFTGENIKRITDYLDKLKLYIKNNNNYFRAFLKPHASSNKKEEITYWERLRFYSLMMVFDNNIESDCNAVKRWLRVTKNLINNTRIDNPEDFCNAVKSLKSLSANAKDIYDYMSKCDTKIEFFDREQVKEEKIKAGLILKDNNWNASIIDAEEFQYFDGQIGFILEMSKDNQGDYNKDNFEAYRDILKQIFTDFEDKDDFLFERALLAEGDYLVRIGNNYTFCNYEKGLREKSDNWRRVFNNEDKRTILKSLLDKVKNNRGEKIEETFQDIINNYDAKDWRYPFIKNPENFRYCKSGCEGRRKGKRQLRIDNKGSKNEVVYLLSGKRMSGEHAELYTYDLFTSIEDCLKDYPLLRERIKYNFSNSNEKPKIVVDGMEIKYDNEKQKIVINQDNQVNSEYDIWDRNGIIEKIKSFIGDNQNLQ